MSLEQDFAWAEDIGLPLLIITPHNGKPKDPGRWTLIEHQGAGHGCHNFKSNCIILPIKPQMQAAVLDLTQKWLDSDAGAFIMTLREINEYADDLQKMGLSCNLSYSNFVEGIYPFDCTIENLRKLTDAELPDDLDDLITFESEMGRLFGSLNRWSAYILGENCD